jgi:hypothetical protein
MQFLRGDPLPGLEVIEGFDLDQGIVDLEPVGEAPFHGQPFDQG